MPCCTRVANPLADNQIIYPPPTVGGARGGKDELTTHNQGFCPQRGNSLRRRMFRNCSRHTRDYPGRNAFQPSGGNSPSPGGRRFRRIRFYISSNHTRDDGIRTYTCLGCGAYQGRMFSAFLPNLTSGYKAREGVTSSFEGLHRRGKNRLSLCRDTRSWIQEHFMIFSDRLAASFPKRSSLLNSIRIKPTQ